MSAPIGISFGDLVALIKILKAAGASIKASGGAADDYQRTVRQLESRLTALQTIVQTHSFTGDPVYVNAIRGQAQTAEAEVKRLLNDIRSYEQDLGFGASQSAVRGPWKKIKWGVSGAKKVERKWEDIDATMATGQMMLDLNTSATLSSLETHASQTLDLATQQQRDLSMARSAVELLNNRIDAIECLMAAVKQDQSTQMTNFASLLVSGSRTLDVVESQSSSLEQMTASIDAVSTTMASMQRLLSLQNEQEMIKLRELDQRPPLSTGQSKGQSCADSLALVFQGTREASIGMCNLLTGFAKILLESLSQLLSFLPYIFAYLRFMQAIPVAVSFIMSDNIHLTDVLGTKHSLPFQNIRNWAVFKRMLETRFRDRPGSDKVASGYFRILNARAQSKILDEENWAESIEPGMHLVMSIEIVKLRRQVQRGSCLRHSCLGILRTTRGLGLECSACGLHCYEEDIPRRRRSEAVVYGPQDFRAEVAKTRRILWEMEKRKKTQQRSQNGGRRSKHAVYTDGMILRELQQCVALSKERANRRKEEGWMMESHAVADLRKEIAEAKEHEEREAREREELELRLFLRVHIRPAVFEAASTGPQPDDTVTDVKCIMPAPQPMKWKVARRRTLVDMVIEENSAWATTCMASAVSNGVEIDAIDPLYGTALQAAASIGCLVKSSFLLEHGADPLKESPAWRSAVHAAAMHNHGAVLGLLLKSCHRAIRAMGPQGLEKALLFRDTCDAALRAATLRGANAAVLSLLNFTDRVHVGTAICSGDESTMKIIMGEALQAGEVTMNNCVQILRNGAATGDQLSFGPDEKGFVYRRMELRL